MHTKTKYKLKNIFNPLQHYMKIAIDDEVEQNENGDLLVNVGYLRVSTDKQAEFGYGLEIQEEAITEYAQRNRYKNLLLFIDDGYTGTVMDRPALNGIVSLIDKYNFHQSNIRVNSFTVYRLDRLGRTLLGTLQFIQDHIVDKKNSKNMKLNNNAEAIAFNSTSEPYLKVEPDNPQSTFLLGLFSTLAEFDRDQIVQKLKAGREVRASQGKWKGGGNQPYGYRYDKESGELKVVPEEAEKVREIFRLYLEEHMSPQKISDRLGFKGDRIITQILKRKTSAGYIVSLGKEYPGIHEPIISLELWEQAQEEMKSRSVFRSDAHYMLSGLLYCGHCGAKMRYQKWNKQTGDCKIVCYSRQGSKPNLVKDVDCPSDLYWASDIETAVIDYLFEMTYLGDREIKKSVPVFDPKAALEKQLLEVRRELSNLYDLIGKRGTDDILDEKLANLKMKRKSIEDQLQNNERQLSINKKIAKAQELFRTLKSTWPCMSDEEKQRTCRELIDRVVIYNDASIVVNLKLKTYLATTENS